MKNFIFFATLLQVAFIVMKLCGAIDWHWLCVMLPILVYAAWLLLRICFAFWMYSYANKLKRKEWARYGADNSIDYMSNKFRQLQNEQMEGMVRKKKELDERRIALNKKN